MKSFWCGNIESKVFQMKLMLPQFLADFKVLAFSGAWPDHGMPLLDIFPNLTTDRLKSILPQILEALQLLSGPETSKYDTQR